MRATSNMRLPKIAFIECILDLLSDIIAFSYHRLNAPLSIEQKLFDHGSTYSGLLYETD